MTNPKRNVIMADVINLQNYIIDTKERRSFTPWQKRFGEKLDFFSGLPDLSDKLLCLLARPEIESIEALRELVMAVFNMGAVTKFIFLSGQEQLEITKVAGFLQEQVYFEIMRRLGWIDDYACRRYGLVSLVENYGKQNEACGHAMPLLSQKDPEFSEYMKYTPELKKKYMESRFLKAYKFFEKKMKNRGL
jgi:hypothetical protein